MDNKNELWLRMQFTVPWVFHNLACACRQTVGTAVLRSCNYIRPTSSVKLLKELPPKMHIWRLTNLKSFPIACFLFPSFLRLVLLLSFWICGRCVLCVWPESQSTILFGSALRLTRITKHNFVWQFYLTFPHFNAIVVELVCILKQIFSC